MVYGRNEPIHELTCRLSAIFVFMHYITKKTAALIFLGEIHNVDSIAIRKVLYCCFMDICFRANIAITRSEMNYFS